MAILRNVNFSGGQVSAPSLSGVNQSLGNVGSLLGQYQEQEQRKIANARANKLLTMRQEQNAIANTRADTLLGIKQNQEKRAVDQQVVTNDRADTLLNINKAQEERRVTAAADDVNYVNAVKGFSNVPLETTTAPSQKEVSNYNNTIAGINNQISSFDGRIAGITGKYDANSDGSVDGTDIADPKMLEAVTSNLRGLAENRDRANATLSGTVKPTGSSTKISREDLTSSLMRQGAGITTGANMDKYALQVKKYVDNIYSNKSGGLTAGQLLTQQNKIVKKREDQGNAVALLVKGYGKEKATEIMKKNPGLSSSGVLTLAKKKLNTKYSDTSITKAVSGLITDADEDGVSNVNENKKDLEAILKKDFKGKKGDMVTEIKGYYNRQGSGIMHNWIGGSPMGDALDNFIGKYKDK